MKKLFFTLSMLMACSTVFYAQDFIKNPCGFQDAIYNISKFDTSLLHDYSDWKQQLIEKASQRITDDFGDTVYTVQVVVHIVYLNDNKYENIPDDIIRSQIDALNRDFNLMNADSVNLRDYFIPFRGNAKIKFELAKFAPNGAPTTGITRTKGNLGTLPGWIATDLLETDPGLASVLTLLQVEPLKSDFNILTGGSVGKPSWNTKKYLNIWVCDMNYSKRKCPTCLNLKPGSGTLLGLAYPPPNIPHWITTLLAPVDIPPLYRQGDTIRIDGSLDRGAQNDGVVIDFRAFGQNNWYSRDSASQRFRDYYSMGRTPIHEVGHYLGLRHTWGDSVSTTIGGLQITAPAGCSLDDFIEDTPNEQTAFANSIHDVNHPCDTSVNTCNTPYLGADYPDMFENYMDYSTDICYNLFTKQQVDFMRFILTSRRANIIIKKETDIATAINHPRMKEVGISVYPNPVSNTLNIHLNNQRNTVIHADIIDVTGKIISSDIIPVNTINYSFNTTSLASGMYILKLYNNDFTTTQKFNKN